MKKRTKRIWKRCLPVLITLALLATGVYAWIYGNVTPEMTGSFKIGSMSGLNFEIDTAKTNLINLNESYGISSESLNLNEVSSADGKLFYTRDTSRLYLESGNDGPMGNREIITFRPAEVNTVVETADGDSIVKSVTGDYMDVSFKMLLDYNTEDAARYYIYFLSGSLDNTVYNCSFKRGNDANTTNNGLKALRASLRVSGATGYSPVMTEDGDDPGTYSAIFGNESELGTIDNPYRTTAVSETEKVQLKSTSQAVSSETEDIAGSYYIDYLSGIASWPHSFGILDDEVDVYSFSSCSINPAELNNRISGPEIPSENYLFMMDSENHAVNITLRVWLEGGSDYCVNGQIVPDDAIHLDLYFVAFCVE